MTDAAIEIDLRAGFGDADQQGRRPTCLAFAATAAHRHHQGAIDHLCVEWLYYHAVTRAGDPPDAGSKLPETRAAIRDIGQPLEAHWPYRAIDPDAATWSPPDPAPAQVYFADNDSADSRYDDIATALKHGAPTVIGLSIGQTFVKVTVADGYALVADDPEPVTNGAGHALLVVGAGVIDARRRLLVRNSWGLHWGELGHAWISEDYLNARWIGGFRLKEKLT